MEYKDIKIYEGKQVKILLSNGFIYSCLIKEVTDSSVKIIDKYGKLITISFAAVSMITPIENNWRGKE